MSEKETPIIDKQCLNQKLSDYGFIPVEVAAMNKTEKIYLWSDLEAFLDLARTFEQKHVFFEYYFYDKDDYIIPESRYKDSHQEYQKKVQERNDLVDQINFDFPSRLTVFIIKDSTLIGVLFDNNWLDKNNILTAEEALEDIDFNFRPQNKTKKEEDEREMREIIFNDPEFMFCKNQDLRFQYLRNFIEKAEHEKFLYLVMPSGSPRSGKAKMFLDKTWLLYQDKLKNKKNP